MKKRLLTAALMTAALAHADVVTYWADAVNPRGNLDYLVEIGPPPFPGYSNDQLTWIEDSFVFDAVDILACDPFATNCNVLDAYTPKDTQPWCPPVSTVPPVAPAPSEVPEPGTGWLMCGLGVVMLAVGKKRHKA